MTKVIGPLFSLSASGTYRDEFVFKPRGGSVHVARRPRVKANRTLGQSNHAAKVSEMASAWSGLPQPVKDQWNACGLLVNLGGYQHYWVEWFAQNSTAINPPGLTC